MDTPKKNTENTILIVLLIIAIIAAFVEWNKARMLSQDLNTAQAQLLTRQAQLENDQMQLKNDQMQLENAQTALSTPRIPVTVNFREADGGFFGGGPGQGLVGDFKNTSDSTLTVIGTFTNPTLNQTVQKTWIMNPGQLVIIGYRQGYAFASGDTILLSSAGYESFRFTVK